MPHVKDLLPAPSQASQDGIENPSSKAGVSKALPPESIERVENIFDAIATHYGAARMKAHWDGLDPERAKSYWSYKLAGMPSEGVSYALLNLPKNPPTINEFIEIAGRRPMKQVALLDTAPRTPPEKALANIAKIRALYPGFKKPEPIDETEEDAA